MSEHSENSKQETYDLEKSPIDWSKLDGILALKGSLITCASLLDLHENTIKNHIKYRYGQTFTEYAERRLSPTKIRLIQKALEMAMKGNTSMMIFSLKNICNWADKTESIVENVDSSTLKIDYNMSFEELMEKKRALESRNIRTITKITKDDNE